MKNLLYDRDYSLLFEFKLASTFYTVKAIKIYTQTGNTGLKSATT